MIEVQGRKSGNGYIARVKAGIAKERFVPGQHFQRHRDSHYFYLAFSICPRLAEVVDGGGVDIERDCFLNSKLDQRKLLFRGIGEGVKVEHSDSGRGVGQEDRGLAAFPVRHRWRNMSDGLGGCVQPYEVILRRRCLQRGVREFLEDCPRAYSVRYAGFG